MSVPSAFAEPTLARLSFWLALEKIEAFEAVYRAQVIPVLKQRGLKASSSTGRATVDNVFSRLFEVKNVAEVGEILARLKQDEAWQGLLKDLGGKFGTFQNDGLLPFGFKLYSAPAGSGTAREVTGKKGVWYTFTARDGMQEGEPYAICQDRVGHLWIGPMGEAYGGLVAHLRGLRRQHDIEGILEVIRKVSSEWSGFDQAITKIKRPAIFLLSRWPIDPVTR